MDDSYSKEPVYRFEMHMRLFSGYLSQEILSYFEGMENRLVSSDGSENSMRLTNEDFYLFLITCRIDPSEVIKQENKNGARKADSSARHSYYICCLPCYGSCLITLLRYARNICSAV